MDDHRDLHSFPTRRSSDLLEVRQVGDAPPALVRLKRAVKNGEVFRLESAALDLAVFDVFDRVVLFNVRNNALEVRIGITEPRSEEHTSELQSLRHFVCRLL